MNELAFYRTREIYPDRIAGWVYGYTYARHGLLHKSEIDSMAAEMSLDAQNTLGARRVEVEPVAAADLPPEFLPTRIRHLRRHAEQALAMADALGAFSPGCPPRRRRHESNRPAAVLL